MAYSEDYRREVMPDLRAMCSRKGFYVALEMESFNEAHSEVMGEAIKRGALMMDDDKITELDHWIAQQLLEQCKKFEPAVARSAAVADKVAADIRRWEAKCLLAQGSLTQKTSSSSPPECQIQPKSSPGSGSMDAS